MPVVGGAIRFWREERRWTIQELADRMGLSRASLNHMELGTQTVRADQIDQLAAVLGVSVDCLMTAPPLKHAGELESEAPR